MATRIFAQAPSPMRRRGDSGTPRGNTLLFRPEETRTVSDTLVIRIHPRDDVVIARQQLVGGTRIASEGITVSGLVPPGHKIATRDIAAGEAVRRYDQIIGSAKQAIAAGQHVHSHNLEFSSFARDYDAASGALIGRETAGEGDE
jgi:hypothetical protein